jgi:hypothetical protein
MTDYKSETLKAAQDADEKDIGLAKTVDAAIVRVKAEKAQKEKTLRPDQIRDGVKAVAEVVAQWGTSQFTASEIGAMIGYPEAFVAKVIAEMEAE